MHLYLPHAPYVQMVLSHMWILLVIAENGGGFWGIKKFYLNFIVLLYPLFNSKFNMSMVFLFFFFALYFNVKVKVRKSAHCNGIIYSLKLFTQIYKFNHIIIAWSICKASLVKTPKTWQLAFKCQITTKQIL